MEEFVKGDIVVVPFPFSNLSTSKRRPALVLIALPGPDVVLCQITSKQWVGDYSFELNSKDFVQGGLDKVSYVRVTRIFTAEKSIVLRKVGKLKEERMSTIMRSIITLLEN